MKLLALRLRTRRARALAALAAAASVAVLVVLGADQSYRSSRVQLHAGTAWLASNRIGQVTLVDGASAQVAAQVRVAASASPLRVAQQGSGVYVLNQATGTLVRVDSATHDISRSVTPIPQARGTLTLTPTPHTLYTFDTHSGMLASTDPETLIPQGRPQPLAAGIAPDGLAVDSRGQPWAAGQQTGELVWLSEGQRRTRPAALPGTPRLTATQDQPALVDPARGTAELLDPDTSAVTRSARPDIRTGDMVAVSGSPDRSRLLLSVGTRGAFIMCTFDTASCTTPLTVGAPHSDLGVPVEVDHYAVVPDYATGQASIIDLTTMRLVAQRQLFDHPVRFELLSRDGIIFFNDPNGNRAGVLDLAGDVRIITKYNPAASGNGGPHIPDPTTQTDQPSRPDGENPTNTGSGSVTAKPGPGIPARPSGAPWTPPPDPTEPPSPGPAVSIVVKPRNHGLVGEQFELTLTSRLPVGIAQAHWRFGDGSEATGTTVHHRGERPGTFPVSAAATLTTGEKAPIAETTIVVDPLGTPPRIDHLTIRRPTPVIGEKVHFSAKVSGSPPEKWNWTISKPDQPSSTVSATTPDFHHVFTTPGTYTINLTITAGAHSARASQNLTVALGSVKAWRDNSAGQVLVPPEAASGVVAIAAGGEHSLALKADGSVIGWGQVLVPPEAASGVVAIAAGGEHSLALKADGSVIGWGYNDTRQVSVPPEAASGVVAIAAGDRHSLALKADGSVIGWGSDRFGQAEVPPKADSGVVAIAAGDRHSLALKADGSVIGWGSDRFGQAEVPPKADSGVVAIAAGGDYSLALKADGSVIGWGHNDTRQVSVPPEADSGVVAIAAGDRHSLALKADGSVIGWGYNGFGQLKVPPEAASGVVAIAAGGYHSLAL
ncbi:hypothetical protein JOF56_009979 [Kibdelosporangium banguiense]|uniref:PKD domain-containing protein n=1 Tax=Kibdelosporangium banguiense TaxID=1365924 RepID=A0ABS4TYW2_9PSEU|nr:PKD domain-containing protein [Kibdelosporangium banguiense]MBP2329594.1 hypothetical protein [Kibdelosporangium banguiense]